MKPRLLELIVCPECSSKFALRDERSEPISCPGEWELRLREYWESAVRDREGLPLEDFMGSYRTEIISGELACTGCGSAYPIEGGIPRILRPELRTLSGGMGRGDPSSDERIDSLMDEIRPVKDDDALFMKIQLANQSNYGFEWKTFSHEYEGWEKVYARYCGYDDKAFFKNRLGLDAGCGMGRFPLVAVRYGAEMVGLDLSNAIEAAYSKSIGIPMFHAIQGDIYRMPFREGAFEFSESLGVIHITPDPEGALESIKRAVMPGGRIFIFVYTSFKGINSFKYHLLKAVNLLRRVTVRIPSDILYWLLYLMVPVVYLGLFVPSMLMWHIPGLRGLSEKLPYSYEQYRGRRVRDLHMNLFDRFGNPVERRYDREEIEDWMGRAGFESFEVKVRDGWVISALKRK